MTNVEFTKKKHELSKKEMLIGGVLIGVGVIFGIKYQKALTAKALKGVMTVKEAVEPMFPNTMSIPEIKEALKLIEGSQFMDALIVEINGVQSIITRV